MTPPRCGQCPGCLTVERVRRLMLPLARPHGPGFTDGAVQIWNQTLAEYPCTGPPPQRDAGAGTQ